MFERISNGFELARSSWHVLRQEKQLIVFPILSGLGCLLVLISFAIPIAALAPWDNWWDRNAIGMRRPGSMPWRSRFTSATIL